MENFFDPNSDFFNPASTPPPTDPPARRKGLSDFLAAEVQAPEYHSTLSTSTTDAEQVNRYRNSRIFSNDINPFADNETAAAQNQTVWDSLGSGWEGFKDNFGDSFKEGAYTWARLGKSIFNFDLSYMTPNGFELEHAAATERDRMNRNAIYNDPLSDSDDGVFTRQFMAESLQNLGFTFGTTAELGLEFGAEALLAAATPFTGGASGAAAAAGAAATTGKTMTMLHRLGAIAQKAFRTSSKLADDGFRLAEGVAASETALRASKATILRDTVRELNQGINSSMRSGNFMNAALGIAERLPFAGEVVTAGRMIKAGRKVGLDAADLFKIGRGGIRRGFGEWQMASSEAAIEAGSNYGATYDKMYYDYVNKFGVDPSVEEQFRMRNMAQRAAMADFGTNVVVLGTMNKLQFGNLFSKFLPDAAMFRAFKGEMERGFIVSGLNKETKEALTKAYGSGFLGRMGIIPQVYKDFGGRTAAWQAAKALGSGLSRFEIPEGVQELIQSGSSETFTDYYSDLFATGDASLSKSLQVGVDSQSNYQGFKTFLSGVITGGPVQVAHAIGTKAVEKWGWQKDQATIAEAADKHAIEDLNRFFTDEAYKKEVLSESFDETIKHIKRQTAANQAMAEATANGDRFEYENKRSAALASVVMHARRLGNFDALVDYVSNQGEGMTNEDFAEAYGYSPKDAGFDSAEAFSKKVADNLKRFNEIYDNNLQKFDRYFRLADFTSDKHKGERLQVARAALMDAIETVAFQEMAVANTAERATQILSEVAKYPSIGSSLSSGFIKLTDHENFTEELDLLTADIKNLQDVIEAGGDKAANGLLDKKKEELTAFTEWLDAIGFRINQGETTTTIALHANDVILNETNRAAAVNALSRYMTIKNRQNGIQRPVNKKEADEALGQIVDFLKLNGQQQEHLKAINALSDPTTFINTYTKLADARTGAYARRIINMIETMQQLPDPEIQQVLSDNADKLEELRKFAQRPFHSQQNYDRLKRYADGFFDAVKQAKDQKETVEESQAEQVPEEVPDQVPNQVSDQVPQAVPEEVPDQVSTGDVIVAGGLAFYPGDYIQYAGGVHQILGWNNGDTSQVLFMRNTGDEAFMPLTKFEERVNSGELLKGLPKNYWNAQQIPLDDHGNPTEEGKRMLRNIYGESYDGDRWERQKPGWKKEHGFENRFTHETGKDKSHPRYMPETGPLPAEMWRNYAAFENTLYATEQSGGFRTVAPGTDVSTLPSTSSSTPASPTLSTSTSTNTGTDVSTNIGTDTGIENDPQEAGSQEETEIIKLKNSLSVNVGSKVLMLTETDVVEGTLLPMLDGGYLIRGNYDHILQGSTSTSTLGEYGLELVKPSEAVSQVEPVAAGLPYIIVNDELVPVEIIKQADRKIYANIGGHRTDIILNANGDIVALERFTRNNKRSRLNKGVYEQMIAELSDLDYFRSKVIVDRDEAAFETALQNEIEQLQNEAKAVAISSEIIDGFSNEVLDFMFAFRQGTVALESFGKARLPEVETELRIALQELNKFIYDETTQSVAEEIKKLLVSVRQLQENSSVTTQEVAQSQPIIAERPVPEKVPNQVPNQVPTQVPIQAPVRPNTIGEFPDKEMIRSKQDGGRMIYLNKGRIERVSYFKDGVETDIPVKEEDRETVEQHNAIRAKAKANRQLQNELAKDSYYMKALYGLHQMMGPSTDSFFKTPGLSQPLLAIALYEAETGDAFTRPAAQENIDRASQEKLLQAGMDVVTVYEKLLEAESAKNIVPSPIEQPSHQTSDESTKPTKPRKGSRSVTRKGAVGQSPVTQDESTGQGGAEGLSQQDEKSTGPEQLGSAVESKRAKQSRKVKKALDTNAEGFETPRKFKVNLNLIRAEIADALDRFTEIQPTENSTESDLSQGNPFDDIVGDLSCTR